MPAKRKTAAPKRKPRRRLPPDPATRYARDVVAGKYVVGEPVLLACKRHLADLKRKDLVWRIDEVQSTVAFFEELLTLDDGSPFRLRPWQAFVVGSIFGWWLPDGSRRFRTAYVETAKGSGKTPMAAGIGLKGMIADDEGAPEIFAAAVTEKQARITFKDATRMVEANPELLELVKVYKASLSIPSESAVFRPVSSEKRALDGHRVHMGLLDEIHEHPTPMVVDKIRAGTKVRRNALIFEITNSGYDRTSVCWAHHTYSLSVLKGATPNDAWFAYVCALDEGDDWLDEKVWAKVNPNLPYGVPGLKYLREQVKEALGMPSKMNIVKRLNFCVWTEQQTVWLPLKAWDEAPALREPERGEPFCGGLDMAASTDLCAWAKVFGPDDGGAFDVLLRFWMPQERVDELERKGQPHFAQWVREGWIAATEGRATDYDFVEAAVLEDCAQWELRELAYDRWNVTQLVKHLEDKLGEDRLVAFGQGFASMSGPAKELERLIAESLIRHGGNPVLRWMVSHAVAKQDPAGNIKPDREKSPDKIDGVVALVMALARAIATAGLVPPGPSIYETRGVVTA